MQPPLSVSHDLWLPIVVGTLSCLISFTLWGMLVSSRHEQIMTSTREVVAEVEKAILDATSARYRSLVTIAAEYPAPAPDRGPDHEVALERVRERARSLKDQWIGLQQLAVVELDDSARPARTVPLSPAAIPEVTPTIAPIAREPAEILAVLHQREDALVPPVRTEEGTYVQDVYVPVEIDGRIEAALVARISLDEFLADLFRARALPYALEVSWNGTSIFTRHEASTDPMQQWWRVEERIDHRFGPPWRVLYRPTPAYAAERLDPTPHYLLFAGLVLSMSLAFLSHQLRKTVRQSRSLAEKNRSLEERGRSLERLNEELEQRVTERTQALEDAVRELEAFNYSVSHDLRSPLGAILNFAAVIEEDHVDRPLGTEGLELVDRIKRSANRATSLLEDLLQLSRASRRDLHIELVDMSRIAKDAYQQAAASEEDTKNVEILVGALPVLQCDPHLVGDVFVNLFTNALKYSRGLEKRAISVVGHVQDDEAVFEVRDTGRGFDMRFASKLFQVFERLHNDDQIAGTGVGLAVVERIVRRHGGRVWAEGEIDRGACFGFSLPLEQTSDPGSPGRDRGPTGSDGRVSQ